MMFSQQNERQQILRHYRLRHYQTPEIETQALEHRAQGWAVFFAAVFLTQGAEDDPIQAKMARRISQNLEQDAFDVHL